MRRVLVISLIAAYVMHMAVGCCSAHEHEPSAAGDHEHAAPSLHGAADHHCHAEHLGCCEPGSPEKHAPDHEHPCHKQACVATIGEKVQATECGEVHWLLPDLAAPTIVAGYLATASAVEQSNAACDVAPPVRAHLAFLVLTI